MISVGVLLVCVEGSNIRILAIYEGWKSGDKVLISHFCCCFVRIGKSLTHKQYGTCQCMSGFTRDACTKHPQNDLYVLYYYRVKFRITRSMFSNIFQFIKSRFNWFNCEESWGVLLFGCLIAQIQWNLADRWILKIRSYLCTFFPCVTKITNEHGWIETDLHCIHD